MTWLEDPLSANALQWDGRTPGRYEVYTVDLIDPSNHAGWWFQYAVDAPLDGQESSALWGAHFCADDGPKPFALRTQFPVRSFGVQSSGFHIRVSKGELTGERTTGGLKNPKDPEHVLRWNVSLADPEPPIQVYPKERHYSKRSPPTKVTAPMPRARASGVVEAGEERYVLRNARAQQSHSWGSSRFARWDRGYATFFRERPNAYVYAVRGDPQGDGSPIGAVHYRDPDGLELSFDAVETVFREGRGREPGVWTFEAKRRGWELSGRFASSLQRMVGVRYEDPDGSVRYCHHGGVADATLELWKKSWGRRQLHQTLTAKGTAAFEQGALRPFEDVEFFV